MTKQAVPKFTEKTVTAPYSIYHFS